MQGSWCAGPERSQLRGIDHDCNDIPDAAMTLAVAALFAQGPTRIRNVYNWRVKVCLAASISACLYLTTKRVVFTSSCLLTHSKSESPHGCNPCIYSGAGTHECVKSGQDPVYTGWQIWTVMSIKR